MRRFGGDRCRRNPRLDQIESEEVGEEVRSAMEWARVRALEADGVSQRGIARRLGINPRTVKRLAESSEPPSYRREPAGSILDPLEPVIGKLIKDWPDIKAPRVTELLRDDYGYEGSVDLVRKRMALIRPRTERPAQRTGYRPAQVMQVDWAEMPTRPTIAGRERRVYALICSLPYSGASTAHFSFDMTVESFIEGHVHAFGWLGGVPRECVYDNLRAAVARREGDQITWNPRFTELRGHYAFHASACTPETPREKGSVEGAVRHTKTGFWPARRFDSLPELDRIYADWRDRIALPRRHASGHFIVADRSRSSARAPGRCRRSRSTTPANVCFFGPPGTGKTHLAIALAIKACQAGTRVAFATAQQWIDRLERAQHSNSLDAELRRLERYGLLVVDEIGYLPLERQAANLLFALVARRYERGSIIVTSNRGFEAWGEILGDQMVAAALIDRLVHHAQLVTLKGKSYRLRERGSGPAPVAQAPGLRPSA